MAVTRLIPAPAAAPVALAADCPAFPNHDFQKLRSSHSINLCTEYAGRPPLIVNTASHCGYTPRFEGLEALHRNCPERGLVVPGFPSDDFNQEAKDQAETADVCDINCGVTFTMLAPSAPMARSCSIPAATPRVVPRPGRHDLSGHCPCGRVATRVAPSRRHDSASVPLEHGTLAVASAESQPLR